MKFLIINGPNLNLLGRRQPDIYGDRSYDELCAFIRACCEQEGVTPVLFQSNHEGAIVDAIQQAMDDCDGIVINPAAYTHTSTAIADALAAVGLPTVEVHLSDLSKRETFRRHSFVTPVARRTVMGQGFEGYRQAIAALRAIVSGEDNA